MNHVYTAISLVTIVLLSSAGLALAAIPDEVMIGGIFDKNWAEGDEGSRTAAIAVEDFNEYLNSIGAHWQISLDVEDAESRSVVAMDKIQAFRSAGIDKIVGVAFSAHINLAASYIDRNDMLIVSHASTAEHLAIDDSVFRLVPNDGNQSPPIIAMLDDAGIDVLVTVIRGDTWGDGLIAAVSEIYNGTIVTGFRYNPDAADFSVEAALLDDIIARTVNEYGADRVGVLYIGTDEFLLLVQAMDNYENVDNVRWFSTSTQSIKSYFFEDPAAIEFAQDTQFTATRLILTADNRLKDSLDSRFTEMYNATISTYGYAAYDSIWLLGLAILQTQSVDPLVLTPAIPHVAAHTLGTSGDLTLTEYGDLARAEYEIWQTDDGQWVRIDDK